MTDDNELIHIQCDYCDRTFRNRGAYISHLRSHTNQNPDALAGSLIDTFEAGSVSTGMADPTPPPYTPDIIIGDTCIPMTVKVKVKKLPHYGSLPNIAKATAGSAAFDLYAAIPGEQTIGVNSWVVIPTGLAIELPPGYVAKIVPRSGLAANHGITALNSPGIIDEDYRGEIKAILVNNTTSKFKVTPGMRIVQMMIEKVEPVELEFVDELSNTLRGAGGFGSTGLL
jgi:dUTP diphosphatase